MRTFGLTTLLFASLMMPREAFAHDEIIVHRKFPNYAMWAAVPFWFGITAFIEYGFWEGSVPMNPFQQKIMRGILSVMTLFPLYNQFSNYVQRNKPVLIINEKGLWYDGLWYSRNIFLPWDDIKNISWDVTSSGFVSMNSFSVRSFSHFPFVIPAWNLDMPAKEIWHHIKMFSKK